jgi:hypothetical protein
MHGAVHDWVEKVVRENRLAALDTIEFGSYDVNGSVRDLFTGDYRGCDMRPGPGVDMMIDCEHIHKPGGPPFSVAVSTDTLEHVRRPWLFVKSMARVIGPGGWVILTTCDYGFGRHDFPGDYWRFSPEGIDILLTDAGLTVIERDDRDGRTLFRLARKLDPV